MLPDLCVKPAQISDERPLAGLIEAIGAECLCNRLYAVSVETVQALVAVQSGQVVGFVSWLQDEMQGVIVGLGVAATHRRFGVATLLVDTLVDQLRDAGLRLLEVTVPVECIFAVPIFELGRFRKIGQNTAGDMAFECRLWGRRNQADGFSRMERNGIC